MERILTIPKKMTNGEELVVIPRREYENLKKHLSEVQDALSKIRQGEKELRGGKTRVVKSLAEICS